jgi:hypothetical protein
MNIDENHTAIKLFNFKCSPEELTKKLGLEPTKTGVKGQSYWQGPADKKIEKIWPHNYWEYRVVKNENKWISEQVDQFIDEIITPKKEILKQIISSCEAEFSIVQYYYSSCNPGLHFDNKRLQIISDIGAEIDIDIYCLSEEE